MTVPYTETSKTPPPWLKQGISAFFGALVVLIGTIATTSVGWREADLTEQEIMSRGYVELFNQLRTDVADLRAMVQWQEIRIVALTEERDSMSNIISGLTQENEELKSRVNWLERISRRGF